MKKRNHHIILILSIILCITAGTIFTGCEKKGEDGYQRNSKLDSSQEILLRIAGNKETWPEMDNVINKFRKIYPNCTIVCEYLETYTENLPVRLRQDEQKIDIFKTTNIQSTCEYKDNALNLISDESKEYLDLSGANEGLVANFKYTDAENTQYAIPYGGEMRGMYVNTTLLSKYNLKIPKNRSELLHCCEVLLEAGYVPLQSSSGTFAQQLLYPSICNRIVNGGNYAEMYAAIEAIEPGISEYFRDEYEFLYDIVEKGYFDYKRVEEEFGYKFEGAEGKARDFLNIVKISDEAYEKKDDIGAIGFLVDTQAFKLTIDKMKSDYHSEINYEFIMSPVGEAGGYAYLSPSDGLAVNNRSDHIDWALEFLDFFFTPEITKDFAKETGKIPNTADALVEYSIPSDRISDVGQVTFSYSFYKTVTTPMLNGYEDMVGISKMNSSKYMIENGDGTYRLKFTLEDYLTRLESEFQKIKNF